MVATRNYTADFYCFEEDGNRNSRSLHDLLNTYVGGHAPAYDLDGDVSVRHQIRSVRCNQSRTVFKAVFGKLRRDGTPEQATEDGQESDVELLPGHGLVEKIHFLFFPDINLVVLQRNRNAGSKSHFQTYLNKPAYAKRVLVPVLTQDAYTRLMQGGDIKRLEISFRKPAVNLNQEDTFLADCVRVFDDSNAMRVRMTLSARSGEPLLNIMKNAIVTLSKFGRASVARATMVDNDEIIDLVLDRVVHTFEVNLLPNGRPDIQSMFAGLAGAKDACAQSLEDFFRP
jgi:hypothetical protein